MKYTKNNKFQEIQFSIRNVHFLPYIYSMSPTWPLTVHNFSQIIQEIEYIR